MEIKIKKLNNDAVIPNYAKYGDAGMDLTAISRIFDKYGNVSYGTGLAIEIPDGYVGLLFPRSSNSKKDLLLANSVGVIDSGYRGEIFLKFKPSPVFFDANPAPDGEIGIDSDSYNTIVLTTNENYLDAELYNVGDKIAQLVIIACPQIKLQVVDELSYTERGNNGFGSTGN